MIFRKSFVFIFIATFSLAPLRAQDMLLEAGHLKQDFTGINCFAQGTDDFLWMGSNEGLWQYDGLHFFEIPAHTADFKITALSRNGSELYAGTADGRLFHLQGDSLLLHPLQPELQGAEINGLVKIAGKLWLSSPSGGLHVLEEGRWTTKLENDVQEVYSICVWKDDILVAGTLDGVRFIFSNGEVRKFEKPVLLDEIVRAVSPSKMGVWVGYDQGGLSLIQNDFELKHYFSVADWAYGAVTTLADPDGDFVYAGTEEFGVLKIPKQEDIHSTINRDQRSEDQAVNYASRPLQTRGVIDNAKIYALYSGSYGKLYIASNKVDLLYGKTAFSLHPSKNPIQAICPTFYATRRGVFPWFGNSIDSPQLSLDITRQLPKDIFITTLYCDAQGKTWMGSFDRGVFLWEDGKIRRFTESEGLPNNSVLSIDGNDEAIYFGTFGGLGRIDLNEGVVPSSAETGSTVIETITRNTSTESSSASYIYMVHCDEEGQLWVGTDGQGVLQLSNGNLVDYTAGTQLQKDVVYSIMDDASGKIWVNTRNHGLYALVDQQVDSSFSAYFSEQRIYSLQKDEQGNLLVIHADGISRIDHLSGQLLQYDFPESSGKWTPTLNAICSDGAGTILCGTDKGLLSVDARLLPKNPGPGPMLMRVTDGFGKRWEDKAKLPYRIKSLRFEYTAIWHNSLDGAAFEYMLEGQQDQWQQSRDRQLTFSGLRPGEYHFRLRLPMGSSPSSNSKPLASSDKHLSLPTSVYSFKIVSPVWQRWWFIALCVVGAGFLLQQFIKIRDARIRRQQHLEKEQIHSQYANLRNQVNPHFLFNSFNTLTSLIEEDQEMAVDYLGKLSDFFRNILDLRSENLISLQNELEILNDYIFLQQSRYEQKLQCQISIPEEIRQLYIPPMSLQLLVENAIKHNIITADKPLEIEIKAEGETLLVINNFQPRKNSLPSTGLGLDNLSNKFSLLGSGSLKVRTENGKFIVSLPLSRQKEL